MGIRRWTWGRADRQKVPTGVRLVARPARPGQLVARRGSPGPVGHSLPDERSSVRSVKPCREHCPESEQCQGGRSDLAARPGLQQLFEQIAPARPSARTGDRWTGALDGTALVGEPERHPDIVVASLRRRNPPGFAFCDDDPRRLSPGGRARKVVAPPFFLAPWAGELPQPLPERVDRLEALRG